MATRRAYDSVMKWLNSAMVVGFTSMLGPLMMLGALLFVISIPSVAAQINGVPASVTSPNFGGHPNSAPGVPASITSLGPNGLQPRNPFFNQPACCINPLFPSNPNPSFFKRNHHQRGQFFPGGGAVYVPYAVPYAVPVESGMDDQAGPNGEQDEEYRGGPTIFDRRGSGQSARSYADTYPDRANQQSAETGPAPNSQSTETPVADQPETVLVFKDGHQIQVQNYAVVGDMLYDFTPGHHHKIAIADLDLKATAKQNDDLGINFQLPPSAETSK